MSRRGGPPGRLRDLAFELASGRSVLTAEKWRVVAVRECERDMRGGFTKSGPGDSQLRFPRSFFLSVSCGHIPGFAAPARGNRRWMGATPPFSCPVRARGCGAIHICATPPGGVAPIQLIPDGKVEEPPYEVEKRGPRSGWSGGSDLAHRIGSLSRTWRRSRVGSDRGSRADAACGDPGGGRFGSKRRRLAPTDSFRCPGSLRHAVASPQKCGCASDSTRMISRPCGTGSGRRSGTRRRRRRTIRARSSRRRWRRWRKTKSRRRIGGRTCSSAGVGSWRTGRAIWLAGVGNRRPSGSVDPPWSSSRQVS